MKRRGVIGVLYDPYMAEGKVLLKYYQTALSNSMEDWAIKRDHVNKLSVGDTHMFC